MAAVVLDCSVALAWCFGDEYDKQADAVLNALESSSALVPSIWLLEILNCLLVAERKRRLAPGDATTILETLARLPIEVVHSGDNAWMTDILMLSRDHNLSAYDAAYLHLAVSEDVPLATLDRKLKRAAKTLNILYM